MTARHRVRRAHALLEGMRSTILRAAMERDPVVARRVRELAALLTSANQATASEEVAS